MKKPFEQDEKQMPVFGLIGRYRTALMGFAALWVYYFHVLPVGLFEGTFLQETEWFLHRVGFCGVDMFFLLSAYGLYHRFSSRPIDGVAAYGRYLGQRLLRIYPVIVPVAVLVALADNLPFRSLIPRLTFYDSFAVNIYKFLWFVPCILILYLLVPFYDRLFRHRVSRGEPDGKSGICFTAVAIAVVLALGLALKGILRPDLYALYSRIPVFCIGHLFGHLSGIRTSPVTRSKGAWGIALLLLTTGNVLSYLLHRGLIPEFYPMANALCNVLIAPPVTCFFTYLFSQCERTRFSKWLIRIFAFFGTVSLEFYALQEWVWEKVQLLRFNPVRLHLLCFLIVVIGACGLHTLVTTARGQRRDQDGENEK